MYKKIGIVTGGGDAPGLNAVIADVSLIPKIPFVMGKVVEAVKAREDAASSSTTIVIAEGA